jgi:hypothetical protein
VAVDVGEQYPMGIVVRDVDSARTPINAQDVTLTITQPDQTVVTATVANPPAVTGYYSYDFIPPMPGRYVYTWRTTTPTLVLPGSFDAIPTGAAGLISLAAAKRLLRMVDDEHDDDIRGVIRAATRAAELERRETIMRTVKSETKRIRKPTRRCVLTHRPVIALTSVLNLDTGVTWAPPMVEVDEHGVLEVMSGFLMGRIRITYLAGYTVIPDAYQEAVGYIVQHLWQNRSGAANRPRVGGQAAEEPSGMGYSIPNRARDLLGHAGPLVG